MRKRNTLWTKAGSFLLAFALTFSMVSPQLISAQDEEVETTSNTQSTEEQVKSLEAKASTDVTKPVIEKIEFPDNGKEIKVGESIPFYVTAYDADSGIQSVTAEIRYAIVENDSETDLTYQTIILDYNDQNKRYEGMISAMDGGYNAARVTEVLVVDHNKNYVNGDTVKEDGTSLYSFKINGGVEADVVIDADIANFTFDQNQKLVKPGDHLTISITVPQEISEKFYGIDLEFYNKEIYTRHTYTAYKQNDSNVYKLDIDTDFMRAGLWNLDRISSYSYNDEENTSIYCTYNLENLSDYYFTIEGTNDTTEPVITSIVMDKQGEILKPGDKAVIRIKAEDNVGLSHDNAWVDFNAAYDIYNGRISIPLTYNEKTNEFIGEFEVTKETYPCEWYITSVDINDTSDNTTSFHDFCPNAYRNNPYYILVKNEDTYVAPTYDVEVEFMVMNQNGEYVSVAKYNKEEVARRTTLKELGISAPSEITGPEGYKFTRWTSYGGDAFDENYQVQSAVYLTYYAVYDKMPMTLHYQYIDENQNLKNVEENILIKDGMTYQEVMDQYCKVPSDIYKNIPFDKWSAVNEYELDKPVYGMYYNMSLNASFKDTDVVLVNTSYYKTDGSINEKPNVLFVKPDSTYSSVMSIVDKFSEPNSYKGLRFMNWSNESGYEDGHVMEDYEYIWLYAEYENCMIRFLINEEGTYRPYEDNYGYKSVMVAEKGDTITIPTEFGGYENIKWWRVPNGIEGDIAGKQYTVTNSFDFVGYAKKSETPDTPVNPEEPEEPVTPDTPVIPDNPIDPEKPVTPDTPVVPDQSVNDTVTGGNVEIEENTKAEVIKKIESSAGNERIEVFMDEANTVSKEILYAAKGKDVTVVLNMGGYSWEINGKDIVASNLNDINLEVAFDTEAIPGNIVKQLAGDQPVKQLSLTHNGDFGFKATLTMNVGAEFKGKYGNLYYYDSDGKMVFMNAGEIDDSGNVKLSFSHASDYAIVISDKVMKTEDAIKDTAKQNDAIYMWSLILGLGGAFMCFLGKKKQHKMN